MAPGGAVTEAEVEVLEREPGRARLRLRIPPDLHYFRGHFTGAPILPGVVQLHWAARKARQLFALHGEPSGLRTVKFQQLIQPDDAVELELHDERERGRVRFRFQSERGVHSSGLLIWPNAE